MKCHSRGEQKRRYFSLDPQILLIVVLSLRWFWVHLRRLPFTERGIGGCPRPCLQLEKRMSLGWCWTRHHTSLLVPIHETASYFHQPLLPLQREAAPVWPGWGGGGVCSQGRWYSLGGPWFLLHPVSWARAALSQLPFSRHYSGR